MRQLRRARLLGDEDDGAEPELPGRPRGRGAVVAGGGGHDRADVAVARERRQRPAPLERAELVRVLALEPDVGPERRLLERGHALESRACRGAALRDLSRRPRVPGCGRRRRVPAPAGGVRGRVPGPAGVLRAAGVQLRAPGGGAPGGAVLREGVLARAARGRPLGVVRDDGVALPSRSSSASSPTRSGSCRPSSCTRASGRCRGTTGAGSPTTTRATCFASSGSRREPRQAARRVRARSSSRSRGRTSAAGSAGRSRCGSPRSRWRWRTTSSPGADGADDRHRRPGLPDAPAGAGGEGRVAGAGRPPGERARAWGAMTELAQPAPRFREIARGKLGDAHTQAALDTATNRLRTNRVAAWEGLPDVEAMRERAHRIKMAVIDDLDGHVARFTEAFEARGGKSSSREPGRRRASTSRGCAATPARSWPRSRSRWRPRRSA